MQFGNPIGLGGGVVVPIYSQSWVPHSAGTLSQNFIATTSTLSVTFYFGRNDAIVSGLVIRVTVVNFTSGVSYLGWVNVPNWNNSIQNTEQQVIMRAPIPANAGDSLEFTLIADNDLGATVGVGVQVVATSEQSLIGAAQQAQTVLNAGSLLQPLIPATALASPGPYTQVMTVPQGVRTLVLSITTSRTTPEITNVLVTSANGTPLYNQPPYLGNAAGLTTCMVVVPMDPVIMSTGAVITVTITVSNTAANLTLTVMGDGYQYKEDVFYNGTLKSATNTANNNSVVIVSGPCRLLTASLETFTFTAEGNIQINGVTVLRAGALAAANDGQAGNAYSVTFPPNTILQAGQNATVNSNGAGLFTVGSIGYAYP
jgi:hypothetical protein